MADDFGLSGKIDRNSWFFRMGVRAWLFLGLSGVIWIGFWLYSATSSFLIPLIVSTVMGILFSRLVDWLNKLRIPRVGGALIVMLMLGAIATAVVALVVVGVFGQAEEIATQISDGVATLEAWVASLNLPAELVTKVAEGAQESLSALASGLATAVGGRIASIISFGFGMFLGAFMLFYILSDWHGLKTWIGAHLPMDDELGAAIVEDSTTALRQYFAGVTISGFIVAVVIGVGLWIMGVPLVIPIMLVTFLTAYIPYFGAIISAVFACLVALGAGGVDTALTVLVVILVAQNVIQTIITNQIASDKLSIHPLAGLLATLAGGVFFGLLGGVLGTPVMAAASRGVARMRTFEETGSPNAPLPKAAVQTEV